MTLQLTPEERKLYDRERNRQRMKRYHENKRWREQEREAEYRRIEQQCSTVAAENRRVEAESQRIKQEMLDLQNDPPVRIVTETVIKEVPVSHHVGNIQAVMKLCNEAPPHWLEQLWAELKPRLEMAGIL